MEVKVVFTGYQLLSALFTIVAAFAVNMYMTRENDKKVKALEKKCTNLVDWDNARDTFVSKELYNNQMSHIDTTLGEIKSQNEKILGYLTNK